MAEDQGVHRKEVKGILKKGKKGGDTTDGDHHQVAGSGIQWDEMNILMTESPADKDYGHMKIEEPKTPYHEMLPDEQESQSSVGGSGGGNFLSADDLAKKVTEAASEDPKSASKWDTDSSASDEEMMTDEQKEHKKQFTEWRKKHYNEFFAVKRARELLKRDEEELAKLEQDETEDMQQESTPASSS